MMRAATKLTVLAIGLGGVAGGVAVRAEPLSKEACDAVEAEHAALVKAGLPEIVKKGPAWAKVNLGPARLSEVARYIDLEEQRLFRCGHDRKRAAAAAAEGKDAADDRNREATPPLSQRKPAIRKPSPPRAKAAAGPHEARAPTPAAKPGAKPKPKVDDAYRPPTKAPAPTP